MTGSPWNARFNWTSDRDAQLRALVGEGMSAGQIAVEMGGLTRYAVIGRMGRIKLKSHNAPFGNQHVRRSAVTNGDQGGSIIVGIKAKKSAAERRAAGSLAGGIVASIKRSHKASASDRAADRGVTQKVNAKANGTAAPILPQRVDASLAEFNAAVPEAQRVTLTELTSETCRWPLWGDDAREGFYCGGAVSDDHRVYCRQHAMCAGAGYTRERGYGFQRSVNNFR